jgi:hypothetical protein
MDSAWPGFDSALNFVSSGTGNYRLANGTPYKGTGHDLRDPGADIDAVDWFTAETVTGHANPYFRMQIRAVRPNSTGAILRYTAPTVRHVA